MQLDACIRSLEKNLHFKEVTKSVLWASSSDLFTQGYEALKKTYTEYNWCKEESFQKQTNQLLIDSQFTMFLVDDIIFINSLSETDSQIDLLRNNKKLVALSLRLHEEIDFCYAINLFVKPPKLIKKCVWDWRKADGDWGYPMSVDGNIYNTSFISDAIDQLNDFKNPNEFEARLSNLNPLPQYMCCYPEGAKLINVPTNRVQNTFLNRYDKKRGISAEELCKHFLNGKRIDIEAYQGKKYRSVHCPIALEMF